MLRIGNYLKIVPKRHCNMPLLHRTLTSHDIRHQFLDYFIKSNDTFTRSGPVVPFDGPSLVSGENNQFNNVFLNERTAPLLPSVSAQPYRKVGEEFKNLSFVGRDGNHNSFFKILRNLSFGDYVKKGVCQLAFNLLKGPYQIKSSRLYGTYVSGGDKPLKDFIDIEMKNVLENSPKETHPFIVHFLTCATLLKSVRLQKATRFCTDRPIIVLSSTDDEIKARCCVPLKFVTEKFSAHLWLTTVANAFETEICPSPSGFNKEEVCHMKPKKLTSVIFDERLESAMQQANDFARIYM